MPDLNRSLSFLNGNNLVLGRINGKGNSFHPFSNSGSHLMWCLFAVSFKFYPVIEQHCLLFGGLQSLQFCLHFQFSFIQVSYISLGCLFTKQKNSISVPQRHNVVLFIRVSKQYNEVQFMILNLSQKGLWFLTC